LSRSSIRLDHDRRVHALLVHQLEARGRLLERRDRPHRLAGHFPQRFALRIVAAVKGLVRTRSGDHLEGRVGDELRQPVPDDQFLAAFGLDETEEILVRGRQMPGERILGFVQMVVRIEDGKVQRPHALRSNTVGSVWKC
jgi:hypothetical protein